MRNICRRVKNVEERLNLSEKPKTVTIVCFDGELPPDRTGGNITIHHVMYDKKAKQ